MIPHPIIGQNFCQCSFRWRCSRLLRLLRLASRGAKRLHGCHVSSPKASILVDAQLRIADVEGSRPLALPVSCAQLHSILFYGYRSQHPQVVIVGSRVHDVELASFLPSPQQLDFVGTQVVHVRVPPILESYCIGYSTVAVSLRKKHQDVGPRVLEVLLDQRYLDHVEAAGAHVLLRVGHVGPVEHVVEVDAPPRVLPHPPAEPRNALQLRQAGQGGQL
mmetsp:Transcript_3306/g.13248  ORF Transcript_3306/g.13248 Transcript_3306/m.13248 type:complete len:219 (-) Transcript_3306:958-1614(-)